MNFSKLGVLSALVVPVLAVACSAQTGEATATGAQDMTSNWFATNIPPGSPAEASVLALVNDRALSQASYVSQCHFSQTQAAAIINYRSGDEPGSIEDDESFDNLAELDRLPFTDAGFWAAALACASTHPSTPGCTPGSHPAIVIELVVDESGSMTADGKWVAVRDSILATFKSLRAKQDTQLLVGALTFDSVVVSKVSPKPITQQDHYDDLFELIDTPQPHGAGTEMEIALKAAYLNAEHVAIDPQTGASYPGVKRAVVLLTDGVPNGGDPEKDRILQLAADKHAAGVELYAVGIGALTGSSFGSYDPEFLGVMAQRGGSAPATCDTTATDATNLCYFQVTPGLDPSTTKQSLITALTSISSATTTCP